MSNNDTEANDTEKAADDAGFKSPYGYHKMGKTELRKVIADLTKSVLELKADKKAFVESVNESIKETDSRIKNAAEALKYAEATGADDAHEQRVADFLKAVPTTN